MVDGIGIAVTYVDDSLFFFLVIGNFTMIFVFVIFRFSYCGV